MKNFGLGRRWLWQALAAGALALGGTAYANDMGAQGSTGSTDPSGMAAPSAPTDATHAGGTAAGAMSDDARVVSKLHHINQMEIDAGKLAQDKGQSKQVRDFGARLVKDHQAADKKLMAYADKKGIDANAMPPAGNDQEAKDQDKMDRLRNLSGAEFDNQFASTMAEGHQKAIDLVQTSKDTVSDTQLRTMLTQLLPTLQKHEHMAQAVQSSTQNAANQDTGTTPKTTQGRSSGSTR
jgi:putative membrane protein